MTERLTPNLNGLRKYGKELGAGATAAVVAAGMLSMETVPARAEQLPDATSTVSGEYTIRQEYEWAEEFSDDPNARTATDASAVEHMSGDIARLQFENPGAEDMYLTFTVQGVASPEGEGDVAGFGLEESKNVELADVRANAFLEEHLLPMSEDAGVPYSVEVESGVELEDEKLTSAFLRAAEREDMAIEEFTEIVNRNPDALGQVGHDLADELASRRGVDVTLNAAWNVPGEIIEHPPVVVTRQFMPAYVSELHLSDEPKKSVHSTPYEGMNSNGQLPVTQRVQQYRPFNESQGSVELGHGNGTKHKARTRKGL